MRAFRVAAAGGRATPAAGLPIGYTISTSGLRPGRTFRVAAIDARSDVGLRIVDLQALSPGGRPSVWAQFCDSTRLDYPGSFSRDGGLLAFSSTRNGAAQIYIASRDGTRLRTVTTFNGISMGLPSWSPDGRSLVFDAIDDKGLSNLFVTGAEGGALKPLTHDGTRKGNPEWSRDGRWIYYEADTSGRPEIWKIPVAGGRPLQLTTQGGRDPREAPDGRSVYFLEAARTAWTSTTLNRVSVDGGNVRTVLSGVWRGSWDVAETGIVFLSGAPGLAPDAARPDAIEFYSFEDGRIRRVGELPFPVMGRGYGPPRVLAVSPDGRWAVVSHMDHWTRDIVVFDNFR
jgi:Tol biopolymer transport system component